jgi:hypothetical protein
MAAPPARHAAIGILLALAVFGVSGVNGRARQDRPADVPAKVGEYVRSFIGQFAGIVAQEDLEFRRPRKQVRSALALLRTVETGDDLLILRDVLHVDGSALTDQPERLMRLLQRPSADTLNRVRDVTLHSAAHVQPFLNPLLAISLLQSQYQSRFRITIKDAGRGWPDGVIAMGLLETAKPTLLRTDTLSNADAPTRGTAWIEERTGRVLETELQVQNGRMITSARTRFGPHEGLGIMVPVNMQTKNPDTTAGYTDFRRFSIEVEGVIGVPPPG